MRPLARQLLVVFGVLMLGAGATLAQGTFEVVGKVVDAQGAPVAGVKITVVNKGNTTLNRTDVTDKRGNYRLDGLLYSQQYRFWTVALEGEGVVAAKASVVGRTGDRTIYDEFEKVLGYGAPPLEVRVQGLGELRVDFTVVPESDAKAATSVPAPGSPAAPAKEADPFEIAVQRVGAGDLEGSVEPFVAAIEASPTEPERREMYARVLLKLDRAGEAIIQANKVVEMAPDRVPARLVLADAQFALGQVEKAKAALAEARRIAPDDVKVLQRLALLAVENGDVAGGIEANEAIVALQPDNTEAWLTLGDLYNRAKRPDKSEQAYRKVTELDPQNAYKTFFNLGALIENRPDLSEADNRKAMEAFRKAIEIKPDYALAHRHLAYALLRAGNLSGAKASFQKYLELEPRASDAAEIRQTVKSLP